MLHNHEQWQMIILTIDNIENNAWSVAMYLIIVAKNGWQWFLIANHSG